VYCAGVCRSVFNKFGFAVKDVAINYRFIAIAVLIVLVVDRFLEDCGRDVGDRIKYVGTVCLPLILSNGDVGSAVSFSLRLPLGCCFLNALKPPIRPIFGAEFWVSVPASFFGAAVAAVAVIEIDDYVLVFLQYFCLCLGKLLVLRFKLCKHSSFFFFLGER